MEENVRVIERIFDILETLSDSNRPMNLTEISTSTEISKTTVHRLLLTMCARHYVEKNPDNTYSIGYKLIEIASIHINSLELLTEAKPFLSNIIRELDVTAHLGILDGQDVIYIERMNIYPNIHLYSQIGFRSPAYCSSIGKCLLSCLSKDDLDDALYAFSFEKHTKNTLTNINDLKKHLRGIRHQGWAMDDEEYKLGHRCVGAPIFDYKGDSIAAISVSGSIKQISNEKLDFIIAEVKNTANQISKRLGFVE